MKGPVLVTRRRGMCFRFDAPLERRRKMRGGLWLPPHWSPKRDADEIARIRSDLRLEEALAMLNVRFRKFW